MEEEKKYISVAEFAKIKKVSPQAVYKRLNNTLKQYVVKVEGRTMLDVEALSFGDFQPTVKQQNQSFQPQKGFNNSTVESENHQLKERVSELLGVVDELKKELDGARATIARKDEQLEQMTARLLSITENQQELLRNSQILQAQAQQKRGFFARLFAPKDKSETV